MSPNRTAAAALVTGSLTGLIVMGLHPTGHDVIQSASRGASNVLVTVLHALALVGQGLLVCGTVALTLRLQRRRDLAIAGLVFFSLASLAIVVAAVASGILAPSVVRGIAQADETTTATMLSALRYTGLVNQAFAKVSVMFSSVAIILWSAAMLAGREMSRGLALFGLVIGAVFAAAVVSGSLTLDIHGFGAVVLGQSAWLLTVAAQLWRSERSLDVVRSPESETQ